MSSIARRYRSDCIAGGYESDAGMIFPPEAANPHSAPDINELQDVSC